LLLVLVVGHIQARDIAPSEATLAIVNALVWTGNPLQPRAQAVAIRKAGVIASIQPPLLAHFDIQTSSGERPPDHLFPCRELSEAGVTIAFGTDAITASPLTSPFASIQMAMERPGPDGSRITLEECLRAYTRDAAYAEFAEKEKEASSAGNWPTWCCWIGICSPLRFHGCTRRTSVARSSAAAWPTGSEIGTGLSFPLIFGEARSKGRG
jgi:hypothetical protein